MFNFFDRIQLSCAQKIFLTALILVSVIVAGILFQRSYHERKVIYTREITSYYQKYFHREPDAKGLKHWVTWALNKWGLKKVEQKGFINAVKAEKS